MEKARRISVESNEATHPVTMEQQSQPESAIASPGPIDAAPPPENAPKTKSPLLPCLGCVALFVLFFAILIGVAYVYFAEDKAPAKSDDVAIPAQEPQPEQAVEIPTEAPDRQEQILPVPNKADIIIADDDITIEALIEILVDAEIPAFKDADGDAEIERGDLTFWARYSRDLQRITFFILPNVNDGTPIDKSLQFCNAINDEVTLIRASIDPDAPGHLFLDHVFSTENGITPAQFESLTRRFARTFSSIILLDDNKILRQDRSDSYNIEN